MLGDYPVNYAHNEATMQCIPEAQAAWDALSFNGAPILDEIPYGPLYREIQLNMLMLNNDTPTPWEAMPATFGGDDPDFEVAANPSSYHSDYLGLSAAELIEIAKERGIHNFIWTPEELGVEKAGQLLSVSSKLEKSENVGYATPALYLAPADLTGLGDVCGEWSYG
jgi:hypothetical protein